MHNQKNPFEPGFLRALQVTGRDAADFVNAQLTADFPGLDPGRWHPAAWCDPKGRALAVMLVCQGDAGMDLVLPAEQSDVTARQLGLYTIGRSVEISGPRAVLALHGEPGADAGPGFRPLSMDPDRFLAVNPTPPGPPDPAAEARWRRSDLRQGMPWLAEGTAGEFLPQMLGLERLGGLSFRKGCYPGQEVIARVHFRGRVTRRATGLRLESGDLPAPGKTGSIEDGAGTATVLYGLPENGACVGLGIVPAETPAGSRIRINGTPGTVCDFDQLC